MISRWTSWILAGIVAGTLLGLADSVAMLLGGAGMFFDVSESGRTAGLVLILAMGLGATAGFLLGAPIEAAAQALRRTGRHRDAPFIIAALTPLFAALFAQLFWMLTSGPSVRELPMRPGAVMVAAALGGMFSAAWAAWAVLFGVANHKRGLMVFSVGAGIAALACVIDAKVLVRLYEPFHVALSTIAGVALMVSFRIWSGPLKTRRMIVGAAITGIVSIVVGASALAALSDSLNPRFVVQEKTVLARHVLSCAKSLKSPQKTEAAITIAESMPREEPGFEQPVDLVRPGADLLLITVDAMRHDRLNKKIAPNLAALASKSVVFDRAYTPYPHTSHAVASLLTGKYTHALLSVPGAPRVHETWPEILRDFRYRTAAFYTNAVFFIDRALFEPYKEKGYGFSYRSVQYNLSAAERSDKVLAYLEEHRDDETPLFSWIHYFDAHEPYDKNCTLFGTDDEQRYDCEIHKVDEAVGRVFGALGDRLKRTIVIVTADHGEEFEDHGGRYHGTTLYDEQARVPLIIHVPGLAHRVVQTPVGLVDLLGTSLQLLDLPVPARVRSRDLRPLMIGRDVAMAAFSQLGPKSMVVSGKHKLICDESQDLCRLYDLFSDPKEKRSLAGLSPNVVADLRGKLEVFAQSHAPYELRPIETEKGAQGWPTAIRDALGGARSAIPDLVEIASADANPLFRRKAAELLYDMDAELEPLTSARLEAIDDPQTQAWMALARLAKGDIQALGVLKSALSRSEPNTRMARIASVERLQAGDLQALEDALHTALDQAAPTPLRIRATQLVGEHARPRLGCRLIPLVDDYQLTLTAADALAKSRCTKAKGSLVKRFHRERFPERKQAIADALEDLGVRVR